MSGAESSESIDPTEFVQRIRELGEKRDQEDAERSRQLEEQILQGRNERLARRAERARSLSPEKASPSSTPRSHRSGLNTPSAEPATRSPMSRPTSQVSVVGTEDPMQRSNNTSIPQDTISASPRSSHPESSDLPLRSSQTSPTRSGTLSWNRRPQSGASSPMGRRPLSIRAAANSASSSRLSPGLNSADDTPEMTRTQIAESLGSKDPGWFRQTADRGKGSAAYRKSQEDQEPDADSHVSRGGGIAGIGKRHLPGLDASSRDATTEPGSHNISTSPPLGSARAASLSRENSVSGSTQRSSNLANTPGSLQGRSPIPSSNAHRFAPPSLSSDTVSERGANMQRGTPMSPSQERISSDRPASPTKGMGGFVQSAMLRRSDSVSKRWSANQPATTLGHRTSRSVSPSKRESALSSVQQASSIDPTTSQQSSDPIDDALAKVSSPRSRAESVTSPPPRESTEMTSPPSPSKRWSPNKASWLASALNKPESPKPMTAPPSNQPSWMTSLAKAKQQRAENEGAQGSSSVGLQRSSQSQAAPKSTVPNDEPALRKESQASTEANTSSVEPDANTSSPVPSQELSTGAAEKEEQSRNILNSPGQSNDRVKPTTPPKDFRTSLKPRGGSTSQVPSGAAATSAGQPGLEFQNVFGKLRKTQTKNYVAPDELKANITRGKAALNLTDGPQKRVVRNEFKESLIEQKKHMVVTGGPQKSKRVDEFKESLIDRKKSMTAKAEESGSVLGDARRVREATPEEVPEGIAMRTGLGSAEGAPRPLPKAEEPKPETPVVQRTWSYKTKPQVPEKQATPPERKRRERPILMDPAPEMSDTTVDTSRASENTSENTRPTRPIDSAASSSLGRGLSNAPTKPAFDDSKPPPPGSSKLAERFNPALAAIFARAVPAMAEATKASSNATDMAPSTVSKAPAAEPKPGPELTHMTKARARGPKRRAPAAAVKLGTGTEEAEASKEPTPASEGNDKPPVSETGSSRNAEAVVEPPTPKQKPPTPVKSPQLSRKSPTLVRDTLNESPTSPTTIISSPSAGAHQVVAAGSAQRAVQSPASKPAGSVPFDKDDQQTRVLPEPVTGSPASTLARPSPPVKPAAQKHEESARGGATDTRTKTINALGLRLNSPTLTKPPKSSGGLEVVDVSPTGRDITSPSNFNYSPVVTPRVDAIPPVSPAQSASGSTSSGTKAKSETARLLAESYTTVPILAEAHGIDVESLISSASSSPIDSKTSRATTQEVSAESGKLVSLPPNQEHIFFSASMYLCVHTFKESSSSREQTEAFFWVGTDAPEAAIDDAQLFVRRAVKDAGASSRFSTVRQGKESASLLQALGGIFVTRKGKPGSPNRKLMLCGRRHLGHIVFDEVKFELRSFCSGFSYLIYSPNEGNGRDASLYLWRGKGCTDDEFSAALLIGCDMSPSGMPPETVMEGDEPESFVSMFSPAAGSGPKQHVPSSAGYWRMKQSCGERYRTRLFRVDTSSGSFGEDKKGSRGSFSALASIGGFQVSNVFRSTKSRTAPSSPISPRLAWPPSPSLSPAPSRRGSASTLTNFFLPSPTAMTQSGSESQGIGSERYIQKKSSISSTSSAGNSTPHVVEIAPFSQSDLVPEGVFLLDAFFEVYVIPGSLSSATVLPHAILLAQDYAILAASLDDRPSIPIASLLLDGGPPRDLKAAFRSWEDGRVDTGALMAGSRRGIGSGGKLKVVSLAAVVAACKEEGGATL